MAQGLDLGGGLQVKGLGGHGVLPVQVPYLGDTVQGYAGSYHDLAGGQVDTRYRLRDWVLHLHSMTQHASEHLVSHSMHRDQT